MEGALQEVGTALKLAQEASQGDTNGGGDGDNAAAVRATAKVGRCRLPRFESAWNLALETQV